ncbi:MAG TPA: microcystin degradation protein MlrC [Dehalococcoidia bacterium]|nr:microcystin degradation protein MlrC [Chloroflexota bacterium]HCI85421.1 microcystin degradation protein MlrC [Dehalococcoidia bacterium]|tara:strand:+ start:6575 stop:8071 length:1497 start_codon:yes stop_codon:yes gene_type:complete
MRILMGGCNQEISTFNPVPCEYEFFDFIRGEEIREAAVGTNSTYGGAIAELEAEYGDDLELIFTYDAEGTAAGPLRHSAFLKIADEFLEPLKEHAGKIDGVYFSMHGAMGTTEELDPEGYLLEEARKILGDEIPIVISMDLHGILTAKMLENISGLASYHTYPHVDFEDTGRRAAKSLIRILRDGAKPIAARVRIPTLVRGNELITETGAFGAQIRYAKELEKHPEVMSAGMFICNPFTDVPELCCQPFVFTDNNQELAEEAVLKQATDFWPNRNIMQGQFTSLEDSVSQGAQMAGPVAFYDAADAPSSGASGDSVEIVTEMVRANYPHTILTSVVDPAAVAKAHEVGVGETFTMGVGGALDSRFAPLKLDWTVQSIANNSNIKMETWKFRLNPGPTAVLVSGNLTAVAMTKSLMMVDRTVFFDNGCDPKNYHSTIIKTPHAEPEFFDNWVEAKFNVDAIGSTSANLPTLGHTVCERPMYPMEPDTEFTPKTEVFSRG